MSLLPSPHFPLTAGHMTYRVPLLEARAREEQQQGLQLLCAWSRDACMDRALGQSLQCRIQEYMRFGGALVFDAGVAPWIDRAGESLFTGSALLAGFEYSTPVANYLLLVLR